MNKILNFVEKSGLLSSKNGSNIRIVPVLAPIYITAVPDFVKITSPPSSHSNNFSKLIHRVTFALFGSSVYWFLLFLEFWSDYIQFVSPHLRAPSAYLQIPTMASFRKKLSMTLGFNGRGSPSIGESNNMDGGRRSLDSGYHSMIAKPEPGSQDGPSLANTFIISDLESSPERSPRKLHQNISPALSRAMQAIAKSVRSTTSYIYPARTESELPSSEWSECETPRKLSRRSSIMSSVRKRTHSFTPQTPNAKIESPEAPQPPVPVTPEKAPALDVKIPNPCLSSESLGRCQISRGSQLLAGVKLPVGPKNLWPGPTRLTVDQARGGATKESLYSVPSKAKDLYVDQEESFQPSMGSRVVWERHRADRERRYMEIVDMDSRTESDEDFGSDLHLVRSLSKKQSFPVDMDSRTESDDDAEPELQLVRPPSKKQSAPVDMDFGTKSDEDVGSKLRSPSKKQSPPVDMDSRTEPDKDVGSELQLVTSPSKKQSSPVDIPVTPSPVSRSPCPRDSSELAYRHKLKKRQMKLLRVRGHKDERPPWRP